MTKESLKTCNLNYLYELAKGDMGFVKEMIDVFLEESSGELDVLEQKIKDKDFPQIRQISHKLRSSIPYVGLDKHIGDDVAEMEELAREEKGMLTIKRIFKKVREVSDMAIMELRNFAV